MTAHPLDECFFIQRKSNIFILLKNLPIGKHTQVCTDLITWSTKLFMLGGQDIQSEDLPSPNRFSRINPPICHKAKIHITT